ncbi:MFS transporter [Streptomyces sp. Qhu-G9]|uniref:MFS transporter n=1 Tax=Streptomyces sp. Qhu-G9 TaxID=3452799 RepID=UPI0022AC408F|nr:MFS transporter [Streptomyces aurantiacus]WAU82543.1 MFS transporter [Streptomyces aurantiacus]
MEDHVRGSSGASPGRAQQPGTVQPCDDQAPSPESSSPQNLMLSIGLTQLGITTIFGAVPSVLLALQVESLAGDDDKAGVLSVLTLLGAIGALVAQPLAGSLSDRTRTRVGSRTPWVLGATAIAAPILWSMGLVESLPALGILYVLSEIVLSTAQGPLGATLPDRVSTQLRGRFSAALGLGIMLGAVLGRVLGSVLSDHMFLAYAVVGCVPVALATLRVLVSPDPDNRNQPRPARSTARVSLSSYWISPREHPDFWWAFSSRLLTYTGFFVVEGYSLYLLSDYVGLGDDAVDMVPLAAVIAVVAICVSTLPAGLLSDRIGRRKIFVVGSSIVMGVAYLIPLLESGLRGYLAMTFIAGLAFGCYEAVDAALMTQVLPRSMSYAKDLGIVNIASVLPQMLAPAIAGIIVTVTGSYAPIFPVGAGLAAIGGLTVLRVKAVN